MKKIVISLLFLLMASPVVAQQNATMKEAEAFMRAFQTAINSGDPDRAASVYTRDAVLVGPTGVVVTGPDSAKKYYTDTYKQFGNHFSIDNRLEQARVHANTMWLVGNSTVQQGNTQGRTHFVIIAVRQKGGWKAEVLSVGINPPQAPAPR